MRLYILNFTNFISLICLSLLFVSCDNTNKKNFVLAEDYEQEKEEYYERLCSIYKILSDILSSKSLNSIKNKLLEKYSVEF